MNAFLAWPSLFLSVLTLSAKAAGKWLGNQVEMFANSSWPFDVAVMTALVAMPFHRAILEN